MVHLALVGAPHARFRPLCPLQEAPLPTGGQAKKQRGSAAAFRRTAWPSP